MRQDEANSEEKRQPHITQSSLEYDLNDARGRMVIK